MVSPIAEKLKDTSEVTEDNFSEGNSSFRGGCFSFLVIITFTERQPHAAQEVMLLYIVHSAFKTYSNKKETTSRLCHRFSTETPISIILYIWLSKMIFKALSRF